MVKMEAFDESHFMHQAVRVGLTDYTGSIVSPMACIFDLKKKFLCNRKPSQSYCYSLGMVKTEAFNDSHFMHQSVRVGHTDHTGSIVSPMTCIFDLKKKFLRNWKPSQSYCYSLGMVKTKAFNDSHFMHQAVRVVISDHTGSVVSLMACIFDLKKKFLCNRKLIKIVHNRRAIALVW